MQCFGKALLEFTERLSLNNDILIKLQILREFGYWNYNYHNWLILYAISSMLPPGATTIARIAGIILAIIGIILVILAVVRIVFVIVSL